MNKKKIYTFAGITLTALITSSIVAFATSHTFSESFENICYINGESAAGHGGWLGDLRNKLTIHHKEQQLAMTNGELYHSFPAFYGNKSSISFKFTPLSNSNTSVHITENKASIIQLKLTSNNTKCIPELNGIRLPAIAVDKTYHARITANRENKNCEITIFSYDCSNPPLFRECKIGHADNIRLPAFSYTDGISLNADSNSILYIDDIYIN